MSTITLNAPIHWPAGTVLATQFVNTGSVTVSANGTLAIDPRDLATAANLGCWAQPALEMVMPNASLLGIAGIPTTYGPGGIDANVVGARCVIGKLLAANLNTTGDNIIPINVGSKYLPSAVYLTNAATSLSAAYGGLYTAAAKGGTALVAQAALSALSGTVTQLLSHTLQNNTALLSGANLYYSCGTAQGAAAGADIFIVGDVLY
jgi:hypothetical protein